jgi:diguanylate cyclase (GGDEF)-like protein/PAS domain S-box-containing protein
VYGSDRLRASFELAPVGIGIVDLEGRALMTNAMLHRLLGFTAEELAALPFSRYTHPDDIAENEKLFAEMVAGQLDEFTLEKRFIRKDGSLIWAQLTVSLVRDGAREPSYVIGMTQDITERKRLERDLRGAEQRHRLLVERVPAVVYVAEIGSGGAWDYVSPQIADMFGFTPGEWTAGAGLWRERLDPGDRDQVLAEKDRAGRRGASGQTQSMTYRLRHRLGSVVWVRDDAIVLLDETGRMTQHGVLVDVTREKELEARLAHQSLHDPLTGLPNRVLFHDRVARAVAAAAQGGTELAVLFIDLDDFRKVNDTFGHACGDAVILDTARRLRACVRTTDTAARLGGDEFALLLEGASANDAARVAQAMIDALLAMPVDVGGRAIAVAGSIGIATSGPADTTETLLRNADLAMYQAKADGRARWAIYDPGMHASVATRFRLEAALKDAVAADEVTLAYQPIVELATGRVMGFEALARWCDPTAGPVPPSEFIPVAEETGLIHPLGRRLIEKACAALREWHAATGAAAYVSVNVSPLQLDSDLFPAAVQRVLDDSGLDPHALVLEVTEGLLLASSSRDSLRALREMGVQVSIDDFGTGYSSLSYLRQLPVDMVKIDQSFVRAVDDGPDDVAFLAAIVRLSRTLGLATIGEGVETVGQLVELAAAGCDYGQGYLFARPGAILDIAPRLFVPGIQERTAS